MIVQELRSIFSAWTERDLSIHEIKFRENFDPQYDPHQDDYRIVYEASFEPLALDKGRIEFWVTDDGYVAAGIETYDRIVRRLGGKTLRHGFAAGHEPRRSVTTEGVRTLFDIETAGQVFFVVRRVLGVVISARMCTVASDRDAVAESGYRCDDWISTIPNHDGAKVGSKKNVLNYRPW